MAPEEDPLRQFYTGVDIRIPKIVLETKRIQDSIETLLNNFPNIFYQFENCLVLDGLLEMLINCIDEDTIEYYENQISLQIGGNAIPTVLNISLPCGSEQILNLIMNSFSYLNLEVQANGSFPLDFGSGSVDYNSYTIQYLVNLP